MHIKLSREGTADKVQMFKRHCGEPLTQETESRNLKPLARKASLPGHLRLRQRRTQRAHGGHAWPGADLHSQRGLGDSGKAAPVCTRGSELFCGVSEHSGHAPQGTRPHARTLPYCATQRPLMDWVHSLWLPLPPPVPAGSGPGCLGPPWGAHPDGDGREGGGRKGRRARKETVRKGKGDHHSLLPETHCLLLHSGVHRGTQGTCAMHRARVH